MKNLRHPEVDQSGNGSVLDSISREIIEQLQIDGRRAYATISKTVGLSEAAVRQRVQRLKERGVIQIVAVTDPAEVGLSRQAMIGISVDGDLDIVTEHLAEIPEVDYLVVTAGKFDLLAEVVCEDDEQLLGVLNGQIRGIRGIRSTETFVYVSLRKQTYAWKRVTTDTPHQGLTS